ncbi:mechanosensitive ion channel family protein [Luteimonas sp. R10]|uniref:mechanosensitive ion channel family protein n=1 Tax=Luteimonas sp. R10 TaxID=3108176 RepID=UPI00308B68AD|nr:mechanosensitive ion channel domain-containing protein [Luteimonas sp. R10]
MTTPDWPLLGAVAWPLLIALLLGLLVRRALLALARRARAHAATHLRARVAQVVAVPAAVALPLLFLSIAVTATPLPDTWSSRIQHWLGIGGLLCLTWLAVRAVGAIERRILREHPVDIEDNLSARRVQTQTAVISRVIQGAILLVGVALALMTFPAIRQIGATLLASAGIIGLVAGIAARPVFGNLIAGLQIALTQPIRLDDVVIVDGEWGRIEQITSAYVVVRVWDERRLVVPLTWFIENPFQNWTRTTAQLLGTAFLWLDYRTPLDAVRAELQRICEDDSRWDGRVCVVQVTETDQTTMQVRLLVSARNSGDLFDLRCAARERMIRFLAEHYPESLPRLRAELHEGRSRPPRSTAASTGPAETSSPGAEDVSAPDLAGGASDPRS